MNEVELVRLIAANRYDHHGGRNQQARLPILTQFLIGRFQRIAARQRQRHNEVESNPRRLVSNQRVGGEQAKRPLRQKQRQPIVGAPNCDERANSTEGQYDALFLQEPIDVLRPWVLMFMRAVLPKVQCLQGVAYALWIIGEERRIEEYADDKKSCEGNQRNRNDGNRST